MSEIAKTKPFPALTPAQRLHIEIYGYVIVPDVLDQDEISTLKDTLYHIEDDFRRTGELPGPSCFNTSTTETFFRIDNLPHLAPCFFDYITKPFIVGMAEEIIGGPARLQQSDAHIRRHLPEEPAKYGFHRGINPAYDHRDKGLYHFTFIKALTNLTDLGPDDGGTTVIAGTHKVPTDVPQEAIIAAATTALDGARNAMSGYFGRVPKADCVVKPIPDYQAPYSTIAYYRHPTPDGSRSGEYFVNTYAPETRPRHEAEVLAFHESIPGHHLQIAIAQELSQLPAFRRHMGMTAFVEGWALYTERLADEMGLYSSDLDRLGMLSFDAWRAARLVVDTGLHAMGWTRSQTRDFLEANTPAALNNIDNEVDRYLNWPGQALAYKTGQFEILALRAEAEEVLGEAFDLAAFHDVVLEAGAVTLPILRKRVKAWQNEVALGSGSR